jgi:hypothetical protein
MFLFILMKIPSNKISQELYQIQISARGTQKVLVSATYFLVRVIIFNFKYVYEK